MSAHTSRIETLATRTADGADLILTRLPSHGSSHPPILLTHGTFSNSALCLKLAKHLQTRGFDAWILDWRGHGKSDRTRAVPAADYETLADNEVGAAVQRVLGVTKKPSLYWIGHSAGGVLPFIYLSKHPDQARCFHGIVTLASQTTAAAPTFPGRIKLRIGSALSKVLGKAPGKLFGLGPEDEHVDLMAQWFEWNLGRNWKGRDGTDYLAKLRQIEIPTLSLAGGADVFIAPRRGCEAFFEALGSADKSFIYCARGNGFSRDFSHGALISGTSAEKEIWPKLVEWMIERSRNRVSA